VYLALNDPYSFMLVQVLADLEQQYRVRLKLYLVHEAVPGVTLNPKLMRTWALRDANFLAHQYNLIPLASFPSPKALLTGQQLWQLKPKTTTNALAIFKQTWFDEFEFYYTTSTPVISFQIKNQQRLTRKGHYLPATLFFAGDWFVGIDRLGYLERKLTQLKLNASQQKSQFSLPQIFDEKDESMNVNADERTENVYNDRPCEVYISLRSPYSYLGFIKVKKLAQLYKVPLVIKPLLPLVMRGFHVSANKMRYSYTDAYREAKEAGIPFSSFNDPLGKGIVNCYQIFSFAEKHNKSLDFIEAAFDAIYVKNVDVAQQSVIEKICQDIELDYQQAIEFSKTHDWQQWADVHHVELEALGLWGVPCFKYGETYCWGQDRLIQIEQAMSKKSNSHET
jgi:2-hydroxychromene-2-carboxylate isomerase